MPSYPEPLSEIAPKIDAIYRHVKHNIDTWEPEVMPEPQVIDDYELPSAPYLDEVRRGERRWFR